MSGYGAPRGARRDVAEQLADEVAGYRKLLELLESEREALRVADADAVMAIAESKLAQVHSLQDLSSARTRDLSEMGVGLNAEGMEALLSRSADCGRARAQWNTLLDLAVDTRQQNDLNARLLAARQQHVDRGMAALWAAAGREYTYGSDGRSQHYVASRSIASI